MVEGVREERSMRMDKSDIWAGCSKLTVLNNEILATIDNTYHIDTSSSLGVFKSTFCKKASWLTPLFTEVNKVFGPLSVRLPVEIPPSCAIHGVTYAHAKFGGFFAHSGRRENNAHVDGTYVGQ